MELQQRPVFLNVPRRLRPIPKLTAQALAKLVTSLLHVITLWDISADGQHEVADSICYGGFQLEFNVALRSVGFGLSLLHKSLK